QQMIEKDGDDYLATQEVYVIVTYSIPNAPPGGRKRRFVQMRGLDNPRVAGKVHEIELASGTWPGKAGGRSVTFQHNDGRQITDTAIEVVLGHGVAQTFGSDVGKPNGLEPGDVVEIGFNRYWVVTGVMAPGSNTFGSEIWARDRSVQDNFGRNNPYSYSSYVVRTRDEKKETQAAAALKNFRSDRKLMANPERE